MTSALFRITQEAINNIIRHSQAKSVVIVFKQGENAVDLSVHDDGCGFNMDQVNGQPPHKQQWGLIGIKERAELIGGGGQHTLSPRARHARTGTVWLSSEWRIVDQEKIRILLADDHTILREGIRSLLEDEKDMQVIGVPKMGIRRSGWRASSSRIW